MNKPETNIQKLLKVEQLLKELVRTEDFCNDVCPRITKALEIITAQANWEREFAALVRKEKAQSKQ